MRIAEAANELAREQLGLSKEQFAFFQENAKEELALAREQADRLFEFQNKAFESDKEAKEFAQQVGRKSMEAMDLQMDYARRDRERYEQTFLPMQDRYIAEAEGYDTPERREREAADAAVGIQRQAEAARANSDARLRGMGIDPSQMRSATLLDSQNTMLSAQQALAMNGARQGVEDRGRAMRADALNVGAGLPAQSLAGFAGAGAAGQGATAAGASGQAAQLGAIQGGAGVGATAMGFRSNALQNLSNLTGSPMQWAQMGGASQQGALGAYGAAAGTMNQGYQNSMQHWKAGQDQAQQSFNNIMSVASVAGGMMMAEGGHVGTKRAAISREKFPVASELLSIGNVYDGPIERMAPTVEKPGWAQRAREDRADADMYTRRGAGSGVGGALTMDDRLRNGMTAAQSFQPTNVWADQQVQYRAEGGAIGALPVQQSRDRHLVGLSDGEYVVPADVVRAKGIEFFDKLTMKYHRENA